MEYNIQTKEIVKKLIDCNNQCHSQFYNFTGSYSIIENGEVVNLTTLYRRKSYKKIHEELLRLLVKENILWSDDIQFYPINKEQQREDCDAEISLI